MESTKNTRKTPRRATMEPLSIPALMPTKDLVSLPIDKQINTTEKNPRLCAVPRLQWAHGWSVDFIFSLVDQQRLCAAAITTCSKLHERWSEFSPQWSSWCWPWRKNSPVHLRSGTLLAGAWHLLSGEMHRSLTHTNTPVEIMTHISTSQELTWMALGDKTCY